MIQLREYQSDMIGACRDAMKTHRRVLLQSPTGSGKTATTSYILHGVADKSKTGAFICHRIELIDQTIKTFTDMGIPFGVIAAGYSPNPFQPIQICSIDTLKSRIKKGVGVPNFDLIVVDECAHAGSKGWSEVLSHWPKAYILGITATPLRLDRKGLNDNFDFMVKGPSISCLIKGGYLSKYKAYAPVLVDTGELHTRMGDYVQSEAEDLMDKPSITGSAIEHYLRISPGKRALVFCVSIKHSKDVAAQFQAAGVSALHIDGTTPVDDRRRYLKLFRDGKVNVLTNVNLFVEGMDAPAAETCILLRPTKSLSLYLQAVGRVLRPHEDKPHAILLDHVGCIALHGLPDAARDWTLEGREPGKRKKSVEEEIEKVRQCPECYHCHDPAPTCPECGHVYEVKGRKLVERAGELVEVTSETAAALMAETANKKKDEVRAARTLEELVALGHTRGYKGARQWALKIMEYRSKWRPQRARSYTG